jgi:hypothetical protein
MAPPIVGENREMKMLAQKDRKVGVVRISSYLVHDRIEELATVLSMMKAVALHIDYHWDSDSYEYVLYSQHFDLIDLGEKAPEYIIMVTQEYSEEGSARISEVKAIRTNNPSVFKKEDLHEFSKDQNA